MKNDKEKRQVAETIGAIQDTLRVHANSLDHVKDHIYAMIISLDLVYMDIVSELPEKTRRAILQNQFDESQSGAENDLVALKRIRRYINHRIKDCEKFIKESQVETKLRTSSEGTKNVDM